MMRIKFISVLLFFISITSIFGQNWFTQNVGEFVSIDFPGQPIVSDTLSQKVVSYHTDSVYYVLVEQDGSDIKKHKIEEADLDEFYRGYIGAMQNSTKKIVSQKSFMCGKLKGFEVEYTSEPSLAPNILYKRVLFFNKKIYQYNVLTWNEYKSSIGPDRIKFFNSFKININEDRLYSGNMSPSDLAYETGSAVGKWAARLLLVGVPVGIMMLIIYLARRAKKSNDAF